MVDLCDEILRIEKELASIEFAEPETSQSRADHITAEEIHASIVQRQPYIDIATVYRTLQ
jgi:hypothetical protein